MIARTWHGVVPLSKSNKYLKYLKKTGVSDCKTLMGNRGVYVLRRNEDDKSHFLFMSLWDSIDSIHKFAGDDIDKARYYPEDKDYLLELEPTVTHYEVLVSEGLSEGGEK